MLSMVSQSYLGMSDIVGDIDVNDTKFVSDGPVDILLDTIRLFDI